MRRVLRHPAMLIGGAAFLTVALFAALMMAGPLLTRPSVVADITVHNDLPSTAWVGVVRQDGTCAQAPIPSGASHRFVVFEREATEDLHAARFVILVVDPSAPRAVHTVIEGREVERLGVLNVGTLVREPAGGG